LGVRDGNKLAGNRRGSTGDADALHGLSELRDVAVEGYASSATA
jgi:hypothetical protein